MTLIWIVLPNFEFLLIIRHGGMPGIRVAAHKMHGVNNWEKNVRTVCIDVKHSGIPELMAEHEGFSYNIPKQVYICGERMS